MRSGPMCAKLGKILNDTLVISYIVMKWFAGCPVQSQRLIWSVGAPPILAQRFMKFMLFGFKTSTKYKY